LNTFNGVDISPGVDPIRNVMHQRADNAGGERRPQQGEHHPSVGAKQKIELVMVIDVPNHDVPACSPVFGLTSPASTQRFKPIFVA